MEIVCDLVKEFHWTLDQVADLTWPQILALQTGLRLLQERTNQHQSNKPKPLADGVVDVDSPEFKSRFGDKLLKMQKPDGTIDMNSLDQVLSGI